jgi:hypothetical protein
MNWLTLNLLLNQHLCSVTTIIITHLANLYIVMIVIVGGLFAHLVISSR